MKKHYTGAWIPFTPAGTPVVNLAAVTEDKAWTALMKDAAHMPYRDKKAFEERGYTVEWVSGWMPEIL